MSKSGASSGCFKVAPNQSERPRSTKRTNQNRYLSPSFLSSIQSQPGGNLNEVFDSRGSVPKGHLLFSRNSNASISEVRSTAPSLRTEPILDTSSTDRRRLPLTFPFADALRDSPRKCTFRPLSNSTSPPPEYVSGETRLGHVWNLVFRTCSAD
jgi:hypothetical protein